MVESDWDDIVVTGQGVTVEKRLDRERFKHLGVVYEIRSDRSDAVDLRVIDTVPASIPVGFHPRYHGEHWTMGEQTLVFEHELEPGEELVTLYGLGTAATDSVERFRTEPTVELRPTDQSEYERLDTPTAAVEDQESLADDEPPDSSSITELANALEADDVDRDLQPTRSAALDIEQEAPERFQPDGVDVVSGLNQTIEQLNSIVDRYSTEGSVALDSDQESRATRFHLEALLFHAAHLREDLTDKSPELDTDREKRSTVEDVDSSDESDPESASTDSGVSDPAEPESAPDRSKSLFDRVSPVIGPGRGLPLFWLISLIGFGVVVLGLGILGVSGQDRLLILLGAFLGTAAAFGWIYPEDKLPLPAFPIVIVLCGLGLIVYPFFSGRPTSLSGIGTILAGVLITTIPIMMETHRWQALGLS